MSYKPNPIGKLVDADFDRYVLEELQRISAAFEQVVSNPVTVYRSEPKRIPYSVVGADGTNWDPGSGAGLYYYDGASWVKL